jgi:hypothetical protein
VKRLDNGGERHRFKGGCCDDRSGGENERGILLVSALVYKGTINIYQPHFAC